VGRDATHRVETDISELRWDREIHELQQFADIVSISTVTGRTPRIYITLWFKQYLDSSCLAHW